MKLKKVDGRASSEPLAADSTELGQTKGQQTMRIPSPSHGAIIKSSLLRLCDKVRYNQEPVEQSYRLILPVIPVVLEVLK